jgi:uncharacterized protein YggE
MSDVDGPKLSVRADVHRLVEPDVAQISGAVTARARVKAEVLNACADVVGRLLAELSALGGVASDASTGRAPLTWSVPTVNTHTETDYDPATKQPTGTIWVVATTSLQLRVRDFTLLDSVASALANHESLNVHGVSWFVDPDNPIWPLVRADAIHDAVQKAGDYAAALGGDLVRLDHLADTGLLGGGSGESAGFRSVSLGYSASPGMAAHGGDSPSLDPVPQNLVASIEARFTMTPVSLTQPSS